MKTSPIVNVDTFNYLNRQGFTLIPLHPYDAMDHCGKSKGKRPFHNNWTEKLFHYERLIKPVSQKNYNMGIRLSKEDLIIDVDPRNFPEEKDSFEAFKKELGLEKILEENPYVVTGGGGYHIFFKKPADMSILGSIEDFEGIEFKTHGQQIVAAGSIHPDTKVHYVLKDQHVSIANINSAPEKLLALIQRTTNGYANATDVGELTPERLESTLAQIPVEQYQDHDLWLKLMMACHFATNGEGRQVFIDWSISDPKYANDSWIIGRRWDSLHIDLASNKNKNLVTTRTLHQEVQKYGGFVTRTPPEQDFDIWEESEDIDLEADNQDQAAKISEAEQLMETLNSKHAVVTEHGKFRIFTESFDPTLKRHFYKRSTKEDFENLYCNSFLEKGDKLVTKAKYWLTHPKRRQYEGVIFDPNNNYEGWLNLWRGWSVESVRGDWSLLQQLILEVLANNDHSHYDYILNWLAYMVQNPGQLAEVALCFRGDKGTGKGTLGRAVLSLANQHGLHISSPDHLAGRFNAHLQNCVYLFADEAFWAGDKVGEAKLKQLITEPVISYEAKGKDVVAGKNLIHIIIASNNDWVVPAGLDGERRFAVFEVNNSRQGDHAFFKALNKQLYDEGGLAAMLYDLMLRDIKEWAPRQDIPQNNALIDQKLQSLGIEQEWLYTLLQLGKLPVLNYSIETDVWSNTSCSVEIESALESHNSFAKNRSRRPKGQRTISALLKKIGMTIKQHRSGPNMPTRYYLLPDLETARKNFQALIKAPDDYPLWD